MEEMLDMTKKKLTIRRTSYGNQNTPLSKRKYKARYFASTAGIIDEWNTFAKRKKYEIIKIIESDGSKYMIEVI